MKIGDKYFVRIDTRNEEKKFGENDFDNHIDYVRRIADERYFVGGGFLGELGGMILFQAENLEEAKKIADKDPLIKTGLYTYQLFEWEVAVLSNDQSMIS